MFWRCLAAAVGWLTIGAGFEVALLRLLLDTSRSTEMWVLFWLVSAIILIPLAVILWYLVVQYRKPKIIIVDKEPATALTVFSLRPHAGHDSEIVAALERRTAKVAQDLDQYLQSDLEQCPRCGEVMDCSAMEMHEIIGCSPKIGKVADIRV